MTHPTLVMADLFQGINRFGTKPAVIFGEDVLTYAELASQARCLAAFLQSRGVGPRTPVAVAMSNRPEFIVADQALIVLGAAKVPINDMLSAEEIDYIVRDSGAEVLIADAGMFERVVNVRDAWLIETQVVATDSEDQLPPGVFGWCASLRHSDRDFKPAMPPLPADTGIILYTGGTTGRQKGVVHTQSGLAINMLAHAIEMGLGDDETILVSTPLPHAAGLITQAGLLRGATIYLTSGFDAGQAVNAIREHGVTYTFMVPTMIYRLLDCIEESAVDLPSLRTILYGAAPMSRVRLEQGLRLLGPVFMQLFGQSEAPDFLTRLTREDHLDLSSQRLASAGRPVTLMQVAIVGTDGQRLRPGEVGEVIARGPYIMAGYHSLPEVSAETLRDGWLHTGDLGWMDEDNYLYLVDRLKDMIISGGMNVYSTEVENALVTCAGVAQVAVVGVPHPDWGEAVVAFIVADPEEPLDSKVLDDLARERLAAYKRPKRFVALKEPLPLTPYGKVDKKALRNLVSF
jgi:fatty-acyl-CoA synthase